MNEQVSTSELASGQKMLVSMGVSVLVAGLLLLSFVLPAEYGIDPTGIGARMGIVGMSATGDETEVTEETVPVAAPGGSEAPIATAESTRISSPVWQYASPYRSDELSLTLAPNDGAEIKAVMRKGERFVFSWEASGLVNFDMHGEVAGSKSNEFTSYWKGRQEQSGHGAFVAPFDGTHGWYWRNRGTKPVTVTAKTSGFYEKLYRP